MREVVLKEFFEGKVDANALAAELHGAVETVGITSHYHIEDMEGELEVTAAHLVRLCDAVLTGRLAPEALETIGFCLVASDGFYWDTDKGDGEVVAETCFDWSEPRINHSLTIDNVRGFRERLLTGHNTFMAP